MAKSHWLEQRMRIVPNARDLDLTMLAQLDRKEQQLGHQAKVYEISYVRYFIYSLKRINTQCKSPL